MISLRHPVAMWTHTAVAEQIAGAELRGHLRRLGLWNSEYILTTDNRFQWCEHINDVNIKVITHHRRIFRLICKKHCFNCVCLFVLLTTNMFCTVFIEFFALLFLSKSQSMAELFLVYCIWKYALDKCTPDLQFFSENDTFRPFIVQIRAKDDPLLDIWEGNSSIRKWEIVEFWPRFCSHYAVVRPRLSKWLLVTQTV